jgi:xanthine/uracil permease
VVQVSEVHAITSAGRSQTAQVRDRTRNYLISMGIRMVAIIAAVFTDGWVRWVCVLAAFVLPVVAVIFANSGSERRVVPENYVDDHALPSTPSAMADEAPDDGSDTEDRHTVVVQPREIEGTR